MFRTVEIDNFKGLKNLLIPELSRITLLGGKNNAGKTSLLEALFLFCDRLNPEMILRQYKWRGVNELALNPESIFAPIFNNFSLDNAIRIKVINEYGRSEAMEIRSLESDLNRIPSVDVTNNGIGKIKTDQEFTKTFELEIIYKKTNENEQRIKLLMNNQGFGMEVHNGRPYGTQAIFLSSKLHTNPSENAFRYGELDIKDKAEPVVEFLQIVEPKLKKLSSITTMNNNSMLYGDLGLGQKIPISYMGDGLSRLLSIVLAILANRDGIVFIDEIENGLHYSVMPRIWESIAQASKEYNCQVIATTHSYECLQSAINGIQKKELQKEFMYTRLEKSEDDQRVIPKSFRYEVLKTAIDRGWEVR